MNTNTNPNTVPCKSNDTEGLQQHQQIMDFQHKCIRYMFRIGDNSKDCSMNDKLSEMTKTCVYYNQHVVRMFDLVMTTCSQERRRSWICGISIVLRRTDRTMATVMKCRPGRVCESVLYHFIEEATRTRVITESIVHRYRPEFAAKIDQSLKDKHITEDWKQVCDYMARWLAVH